MNGEQRGLGLERRCIWRWLGGSEWRDWQWGLTQWGLTRDGERWGARRTGGRYSDHGCYLWARREVVVGAARDNQAADRTTGERHGDAWDAAPPKSCRRRRLLSGWGVMQCGTDSRREQILGGRHQEGACAYFIVGRRPGGVSLIRAGEADGRPRRRGQAGSPASERSLVSGAARAAGRTE